MEKKVAYRKYKVWMVIEEHTVFEDESDDYKDVENDSTISTGCEFDTLEEALEQIREIHDTFKE